MRCMWKWVIPVVCGSLLLMPGVSLDAAAQAYPNRAIRMVVPFPPGGGTDTAARIVSAKVAELLPASVVIENRPGAGSMLGTELVAKAKPDGYTLLTVGAEFSINPSLQPKVPYDAQRDFAPISQTLSSQYVFSTHPSVPVRSVEQFIALAKAHPGKLNYGSSGNGSANHLAGSLFQLMSGTTLVHIPYKGGAPLAIALMSGEIDFMFSSTAAAVAQVRTGKVRALAVTGVNRFSELPDVPTVAEAGLPGYVVTGWFGVLAPAGTPRELIEKLNTAIVKAMQDPRIRERVASVGNEPVGNSPEEFSAFLRTEIAKWSKVVKASGARPD